MKARIMSYKSTLAIVAICISLTAMPQSPGAGNNGKCHGMKNIPGLSDEQVSKIDALKVDHLQQMNTSHANIQTLQAELHELEIAENVNMDKIYSKIDEISAVKTKMAKERSKHRQDIRKLLTKEQQVYFDSHMGKAPGGMGHGHPQACLRGHGKGHGFSPGTGYSNRPPGQK
jgi:Spy/CpxP family protein refolding chaperone